MRGGGAARACAREVAVAVAASRPREEDDRRGSWLGRQRRRPSGGWRRWPNGRGKGSGPAVVEGEAGRGWAESRAGAECKKKIFLNFN
jgi:hypothetical protein